MTQYVSGAGRVVAVANQKGGAGKTTIAVNLACALGAAGRRVLLVDVDPQADATKIIGGVGAPLTVADVLPGAAAASEAIVANVTANVDLLGGSPLLSEVELALAGRMLRERYLSQALEPVKANYDLVIIDCPPNLGLLAINALAAADEALVVVNMVDANAYLGALALVRTVGELASAGFSVRVQGLLRNNVRRTQLVYRELNHQLLESGVPVLETEIPMATEWQNAATERIPLVLRNPDHIGAEAIRRAAEEILAGEAVAHAA